VQRKEVDLKTGNPNAYLKAQGSLYFFGTSLEKYERDYVQADMTFINELTFENGAIYKGYLRDGQRQGPGIQVW